MVFRLQDVIDENGRYSFRLKDLAIGYAAAKGMTELEAKQEINRCFEREMGIGLKDYLEDHRRERGLEVEPRGRGR